MVLSLGIEPGVPRAVSAFDGAGEAADDPLLEDREEDQHGQHGE
jgi:hypothetical protein